MSLSPSPDIATLVETCHTAADASAEVIAPLFRATTAVDNKDRDGGFDPVTEADRAAETAIRRHIEAAWPDHGIIGEEHGAVRTQARYTWVIDPIDGTRSFITGVPLWGTLIGVACGGVPLVGMMNQPFTGERYWSDATASYLRTPHTSAPQVLKTRACASLENAIVAATHPDIFSTPETSSGFARVSNAVRMTRFGYDCYAYCRLAAGSVDAVVEANLQIYDILPLIPIIEGAGGRVTTWDGGSAAGGGNVVASGDPALHDALLALLRA